MTFVRWLTRVNAFRIGLVTGLFYAVVHLVALAGRTDIPVLSRLEHALKDVKFHQRQFFTPLRPSGRVVVAAVDEKSIAKFGRFPWDRRVIATLVDRLTAEGATAIGFDMAFSDEDLGAQFAGAKRFKKRFEDISLGTGLGKQAVDHFVEAEADINGASSALGTLERSLKPGGEPIYRVARGRLEDGRRKLAESKDRFQSMVKEHLSYASELENELDGLNPDQVLGRSIEKSGKVVLGIVALTDPEARDFAPRELEADLARVSPSAVAAPVYRETVDGLDRDTEVDPNRLKIYSALRAPLPAIAAGKPLYGFFNTLPDADGVIRSVPMAMRVGGTYLPSLEAMMFAKALGVEPRFITPLAETTAGEMMAFDLDKKALVPTDERGLLAVNYFGGKGTHEHVSIADIIDGKVKPGQIRGKLVLVAATAHGTFDQRVTPFEKITAGVAVHANALDTMLTGSFLRKPTFVRLGEPVFLFLLAFVFALVFARVRVSLALPVVAASAIALWLADSTLFGLGYDVFAALPLVEMFSMFTLVTVYRYATEERDKRQLRKAFQLYLNPAVMDEMLESPEKLQLGGEERELTVLFSDIRGFTTISEKLSPQALVKLLNAYLSPMTDIVFARRGTLDKYIGDAVMAFFGAPIPSDKHALDACETALEMMTTLARLREEWRIEDPSIPEVDIGIGVNTGQMVVGNMGSSQRFNYTVMGDNVNLASRLEGLNKEYGTHILVTDATLGAARKAAGREDALAVRELDSVRVKGKKEPVKLFELRGLGAAPEDDRPLLDTYAHALSLYRAQKFAEARLEFENCLSVAPDDGPSRLFVARCDDMLASPPGEGWDGVFKMEHK